MPEVERWMQAYVSAWNSNDADAIGDLFTADATYRPAPYEEPWRGRDAIVAGWLDRRDEPGNWTFTWTQLSSDGDLAIVEGTTAYSEPKVTYSNLWLIRLDDEGRCREFVEWWMAHPAPQ
jgi:uncharacterized protein (TIGR02246 family)